MWKNDYKRYFFSKNTAFILAILIGISAISFFFSLGDKNMFMDMYSLESVNQSPDINLERLELLIEQYTGLQFLFDFWFVSDLFPITMILLYAWVGIAFAPQLQIEKENALGNLLIIRGGYKKRAKALFTAQSLYIATIIFISILISFICALFFGGFRFNGLIIGDYELKFFQALLLILFQIGWVSIIIIMANATSLFCNHIIKNKYVLQILPFLMFAFLPMLLGSTIGNISELFARIIIYFNPWEISTALHLIIQQHFDATYILLSLSPVILSIVILIFCYMTNIKTHVKDYL